MQFLKRAGYAGAILGAVVSAASLGGCEAAGFVGDAFEIGWVVVEMGKAEDVVDVSWEQATEAAHTVAGRLGLTFVGPKEYPDKRKRELLFEDDRGQKIVVTIVRRTAVMTELRVDVSVVGTEGIAKLVLKRMKEELRVDVKGPAESEEERSKAEQRMGPVR
jgi:hypothetical protein